MADRSIYFTTNAVTALLDPDAVLTTQISVLSSAVRYDDNGNATSDSISAQFKNIHTIAIPSGTGTNDSLTGTTADELLFWDFATLPGVSVSLLPTVFRFGMPTGSQAAVIENVDMGGGDDIVNLTYNQATTLVPLPLVPGEPYTYDITIHGGDGNDVIWSGAGNDVLYGDAGADTLDGGAGNDTVYGGVGTDTLSGGTGDDVLYATDGAANAFGGAGADFISFSFGTDSTAANHSVTGSSAGPDDATDGADRIYTTGLYDHFTMSLGAGGDIFIASDADNTINPAGQSDVIDGQSGNDVISTWAGSDTLYGGAGNDALWGGDGTDTLYGGDGNDYLYGGPGDNDVIYGGPGADIFYFSRADGANNQVYDLFRETGSGDGQQNYIVVYGDPDPNEAPGSDFIANGTGVYETDHNIMDNSGGDDMVYVSQVSGNIYHLEVVGGGGTTGMSMDFDVRDINGIVLVNSDAPPGQQLQVYYWDGSQFTYSG